MKSTKVLLGETMPDRVAPAANAVGARTFRPRSSRPTRWMSNQVRWIRAQINSGTQIYDIGIDLNRPTRSPFYAAEVLELKRAGFRRLKMAGSSGCTNGFPEILRPIMRTESSPARMSGEEMLADFEKQVTSKFQFLETMFDLPLLSAARERTEFAVRYGSPTERVVILMEPYSAPWIVLERKKNSGWKTAGLHRLYKKHFGEAMPGYPKKAKSELYDTSNLDTLRDVLFKNLRLFHSLMS